MNARAGVGRGAAVKAPITVGSYVWPEIHSEAPPMNLGPMNLHAPNHILFIIAGLLAFVGVLAAIGMPIPGLFEGNAALYIFLGWFLLAVANVLPQSSDEPAAEQPSAQR
jgi:hypothetical protein